MDGRNATWLSDEFLVTQIVTPTMFGLFADDECTLRRRRIRSHTLLLGRRRRRASG